MDEREATAEVATTAADAGGPQQQPEKPAAAATEATATATATGAAAAATAAAAVERAAAEGLMASKAAAVADPTPGAGQTFQRGCL